jgi:Domain of unknown function (DUF3471)/Beta-lactamase
MKQIISTIVAAAVASGLWHGAQAAMAPAIAPHKIDVTVARAMKAFDVPGVAVAIVKDGKLVFAKGYGVRELGKPLAVDADTLFQIGSNTRSDVAAPHAIIDGKLTAIRVQSLKAVGPAGTINCSVNNMSKWLLTQLSAGTGPGGQKIFSAARGAEMWSINTMQTSNPSSAALTHTDFLGYGLGWEIQDQFGHKRVSHTGGVPGTVTWVSMIPDLQLGVLVFTNQEDDYAMEAVGNQILDAYLGAPPRDWVARATELSRHRSDETEKVEAASAKIAAAAVAPPLPLDSYAGRYADAWRGEAAVRLRDGKLMLKFSRTQELEGSLAPFSANIFIVKWLNRGLHADAYVRFSQGFDGKIDGMTMQAVSPATDFSFDFQDLNFKRLE